MRTYDGNQVIQWDYTEKGATPFIHIGNKMYECHRGKDWKAKVKKDKKEARLKEMSGNPDLAKKMRKHKVSKKAGCPARITMREVMMFPSFQASNDTSNRRRTASQLRAVLNQNPDVGERRFYISFPTREDHHSHHLDDSDRDDVILDPRLLSRIHELQASSQVQTITDMKFLLKEFVTDVLCKDQQLPPRKDRRFFPTVSDIRKVLKRSSTNLAHSKSVLVVHCHDDSSKDLSRLDVRVIDDVLGKFEVSDESTSGGNVNTVKFNSDSSLPACSCSIWYKGKPPCQHFRAVFDQTSWGAEKLPDEWRTFTNLEPGNEYFVATLTPILDHDPHLEAEKDCLEEEEFCGEDSTNGDEEEEEGNEPRLTEMMPSDEVEEDTLEDLRQECRDRLHRIEDLTHLVNNTEGLSRLKEILSESVRDLEELIASNDSSL